LPWQRKVACWASAARGANASTAAQMARIPGDIVTPSVRVGSSDNSNPVKIRAPMHSADRAFIAETTAKMLLEVKAVLFFTDKPFTLPSGGARPVYVDCRSRILSPPIRRQLVDCADASLARAAGFEQFDVVAGGETAGIPYAAWIAERFDLPMQYVRKKA